MRLLIASLAALALSACAGMTPQQIAGTAHSGLYAAATIAQAGTVDARLAPTVTRARRIVERATRMHADGRIDSPTARTVRAHTDAAVSEIRAGRAALPAQVDAHIAAARTQLDTAESILESVK